jgi:hypothetical protein
VVTGSSAELSSNQVLPTTMSRLAVRPHAPGVLTLEYSKVSEPSECLKKSNQMPSGTPSSRRQCYRRRPNIVNVHSKNNALTEKLSENAHGEGRRQTLLALAAAAAAIATQSKRANAVEGDRKFTDSKSHFLKVY